MATVIEIFQLEEEIRELEKEKNTIQSLIHEQKTQALKSPGGVIHVNQSV